MKRIKQHGDYYFAHFDPDIATIERHFDDEKIYLKPVSPELLDISLLRKCDNQCSYCYTDSNHNAKSILSFDDYVWLLTESMDENTRPFQVALGGGEPGLHPNFRDILQFTREIGVVPNLTTNGTTLLDDKNLEAIAKYCGGISLTYHWDYPDKFWIAFENLKQLSDKIQTSVQFIVATPFMDQIEDIIIKVKDHVKYVIFLEFHMNGRASSKTFKSWRLKRLQLEKLKDLIKKYNSKVAVGASLVPLLFELVEENPNEYEEFDIYYHNPESMLTGYVNENLELMPSSFWHKCNGYVKIKDYPSFFEAYNSSLFQQQRMKLYNLRYICKYGPLCNGGMHGDYCYRCKILKSTYNMAG